MADGVRFDAAVRIEAIEPGESFIIQAPAGSGKTSLLTNRFLRLLAVVERPEEIVAITFTRKAAAEMRQRIVEALAMGPTAARETGTDYERRTAQLARDALANSDARGWNLAQHPSRLHIQTIDGLNHWLARRLPLSARLGLAPQLLDDARPVFAEAARRFVSLLETANEQGDALLQLARMLDHDPGRLENLLADMLQRRELWLPKLFELAQSTAPRAEMEGLLAASVESELARLRAQAEVPLAGELLVVIREAAAAVGADSPLWPLRDARSLPAAGSAALDQWNCLATAVLTNKGELRKTVNVTNGFPPSIKELRTRMTGLLAKLPDENALVSALGGVRLLPPCRYTDAQWQRVEALLQVLVPAAAALQQSFAERGQLDHPAVAAAAREALGGAESPSELALALEYRIRHLLVDEYQDTSPVQQSLLARLVAGWQPGDGHTLFCVGDPMQSIYGFREADVTLFLEAQARGIGDIPLAARRLASNFRSCQSVVDWVNAAFAGLLPPAEDYERGAVPYSPSEHTRADEPHSGVRVHALLGDDRRTEAARVADIVGEATGQAQRLEQSQATGHGSAEVRSIAILVRSRTVLPPILAELRRRGIGYRGVELEALSERAAVQDILALARALLHAGDRTAWLAVLRAPWCGLTLHDLHRLAAPAPTALVVERLRDVETLAALSEDGRRRCTRTLAVLEAGLGERGRRALGSWVRSVWLALGGPATLSDASDLDNAEACFGALDRVGAETRGRPEGAEVEEAVAALMASPVGQPDARLQIMTIHKAKGLQFDTVILPCIGRGAASADTQLMYWTAVAATAGRRGIVLAGHGDRQDDPLESWMRRLERDRRALELGRLAYVAATRAMRSLHIVGSARLDLKGDVPSLARPRRDSLLAFSWPVLQKDFECALAASRESGESLAQGNTGPPARGAPPFRRLSMDYRAPPPPVAAAAGTPRARRAGETVRPDFDWAGIEAIAVGTVVHAELERIARGGRPLRAAPQAGRWRDSLARLGLPDGRLDTAAGRVERALAGVAGSEFAAGLLDPARQDAASELALTARLGGELVSVKIDRTFVDDAGVRWIVDWKVSAHEGGAIDEFLQHELERYEDQLQRYAQVMRLHDARPQRVLLYFPLLDAWREWQPPAGQA